MSLEMAAEQARTLLEAGNAARERALRDSRALVRLCANAIRAAHRGDDGNAGALLDQARGLHADMVAYLADHPAVYWAGYVQDAEKELAEAAVVQAALAGAPLPAPSDLGIGAAPYLNGLGDAVGEFRRYLLDRLRAGRPQRGEEMLGLMEEIYALLTSLDYPDALTGGLRRSADAARGTIERTRGDWTTAALQLRLAAALEKTQPAAEGVPASEGRRSGERQR